MQAFRPANRRVGSPEGLRYRSYLRGVCVYEHYDRPADVFVFDAHHAGGIVVLMLESR